MAGPQRRLIERNRQILAMHQAGMTRPEIAAAFDLHHASVAHALKVVGVPLGAQRRAEPGQRVQRKDRKRTRAELAEQMYGMSYEQYKAIPRGTLLKFRCHRNSAADRGIPFNLTLAEWLDIWMASGKWEQRGVGKEGYCMSRFGDEGGYEVGNVHIQPVPANSREASAKWIGKTKANRGVFNVYPGTDRPFVAKYRQRDLGRFATEADAVAARNEAIAQDTLRSSTTESSLSFRTPKSRTQQHAIFLSDGEQCK